MTNTNNLSPGEIALQYTKALTKHDYDTAYTMTSTQYQSQVPSTQMREAFETMISDDWGPIGPIEVAGTMTEWANKHPEDVEWVYVTIPGDVYSEAVTVVITRQGRELKIREVEFGRP